MQSEDPSAGWELLAAAQSSHSETRAHARALLSSSRSLSGIGSWGESAPLKKRVPAAEEEEDMKAPYGLEIIENCAECTAVTSGDFCAFSQPGSCLAESSQPEEHCPSGSDPVR
jgi:hypothetical protein